MVYFALSKTQKSGLSRIAPIVHFAAVIIVLVRFVIPGSDSEVVIPSVGTRPDSEPSIQLLTQGRHDVRVYVYSMPPKFNRLQVEKSRQHPAPIRDPVCDKNFYSAEVTIHRKLLRSPVRTHDPAEADFFYVPIYVTCFLINNHPNNLTKTGLFFEEGMQFIVNKYPYFNETQGRDHVYTFTQGFGARLSGEEWRKWRNGIFLTHNGDFQSDEYTPRKDIVIPPDLRSYLTPVFAQGQNQTHKARQSKAKTLEQRRFLAQFGGQAFSASVADHRGHNYSGGVRQVLSEKMYHVPGFRVTGTRARTYLSDMRDSLFCLAPEGWHPWSPRPYYALLMGCLPVVLSDRQELAFETSVPYDDFVVWIRPGDVFFINQMLRKISVEEIERRMHVMQRLWKVFWYGDGGVAMDVLLSELSKRKYRARPRREYQAVL